MKIKRSPFYIADIGFFNKKRIIDVKGYRNSLIDARDQAIINGSVYNDGKIAQLNMIIDELNDILNLEL